MRDTKRGRDTGRGRSRLHAPGAQRGIRSRVSRIAPRAKGRRQTAAPPRDPPSLIYYVHFPPQTLLLYAPAKVLPGLFLPGYHILGSLSCRSPLNLNVIF